MTNRGRKRLDPKIDLDEECGGTEESVELNEEDVAEPIYYNGTNQEDPEEGGLFKLVPVEHKQDEEEGKLAEEEPVIRANENVIHIECEDMGSKSFDASMIEKNQSNMSGISSQSDRKGFTTNLYFIKEYCIALCEFVRDNQIFKTQFKNNISKALEFNLPSVLKDLRGEENTEFLYAKRSNKVAISELVWNQFNAQYESLKFISNAGKTG